MFCWKGITPYVGGGVGYAKNWVGDYQDINVPNKGVAFGKTTDEGGLAWALHAGLAYDVTPNFTIELAYRYLNLGDARCRQGLRLRQELGRRRARIRQRLLERHHAGCALEVRLLRRRTGAHASCLKISPPNHPARNTSTARRFDGRLFFV